MVTLLWCFHQKKGLELVDSNTNMSLSYINMAEESLHMINKNRESRIWLASTSYYTMYYSLYSILIKIGIKCEIHQCSIECMYQFLSEFYSLEEYQLLKKAFEIRNDLQYYPDRMVNTKDLIQISEQAVDFFIKSKEIFHSLKESEIKIIREKFSQMKNK